MQHQDVPEVGEGVYIGFRLLLIHFYVNAFSPLPWGGG